MAKGRRDLAQRTKLVQNGRLAASALAVSLAVVSAAAAQEPATRAEADRQRREEKSRNAEPYKPGGFERAMHFVEEKGIFILGREGLYPKLGSLTTGSGFAYGAGYPRSRPVRQQGHARPVGRDQHAAVLGDRGAAHVSEARAPAAARRGLGRAPRLPAGGFLRHRPRLGARRTRPAMPSDRTSSAAAPASGRFRIVLVGGGVEYLNPRLGPGKDSRVPSIEQVFDPVDGARARRVGGLPPLDGLRGGGLSRSRRTRARAAGIASTSRTSTIAPPAATRSTASTPTCVSSSASSPGAASSPPGCSCRRRTPAPAT